MASTAGRRSTMGLRNSLLRSFRISEFRECSSGGGNVALIKQLRERTGAPMKDVKAVLQQCEWNTDAAFTELRKRGLAAASKKSSRVSSDGLLGFAQEGSRAAVVEINSETDFVARNGLFQHLVSTVARAALEADPAMVSPWEAGISVDSLKELRVRLEHQKLCGESTVQEAVSEVGSIMGEHVKLRRGFQMASSSSGVLCSYLHSSAKPDLARIVGLLTLEPEGRMDDPQAVAELQAVGSTLAMHVVAQKPLFLSKDTISAEALDRERDILKSQAISSGKPEKVIEKMVDGRLRKYMEDVAFLEQRFVVEESKTVQSVLNELSKKLGIRCSVGRFLRMEVGEGIEKVQKDFAAEVAAAQAA